MQTSCHITVPKLQNEWHLHQETYGLSFLLPFPPPTPREKVEVEVEAEAGLSKDSD